MNDAPFSINRLARMSFSPKPSASLVPVCSELDLKEAGGVEVPPTPYLCASNIFIKLSRDSAHSDCPVPSSQLLRACGGPVPFFCTRIFWNDLKVGSVERPRRVRLSFPAIVRRDNYDQCLNVTRARKVVS